MVGHIECHVATKTFTQVDRMVKTLVAAVNSTSVTAYGGAPLTITPVDGVVPFNAEYFTHTDIVIWNPNGDGRSNISHISTTGTMKDTPLNKEHPFPYTLLDHWQFGPDAPVATSTVIGNIDNSTHDPDVRALYPHAPCRTTHAKCVVDINMGGGSATLRAVPLTKDMFFHSPKVLRERILADRHTVKVLEVGGRGAKDRRFTLSPWVQSRKAVGEFSVAKHNPAEFIQNATLENAHPQDSELPNTRGYAAIYTDEFCYGGWVLCFENIAPPLQGTSPWIRIATTLKLQIQLSLEDNHLRDTGRGSRLSDFIRQGENSASTPAPPKQGPVVGGAVEAAIKDQEKPAGDKTKKQRQGKMGDRKSQGNPGVRGTLTKKDQAKKSAEATAARAKLTKQAIDGLKSLKNVGISGKQANAASALVDALGQITNIAGVGRTGAGQKALGGGRRRR
jgi:hypothetical protein